MGKVGKDEESVGGSGTGGSFKEAKWRFLGMQELQHNGSHGTLKDLHDNSHFTPCTHSLSLLQWFPFSPHLLL